MEDIIGKIFNIRNDKQKMQKLGKFIYEKFEDYYEANNEEYEVELCDSQNKKDFIFYKNAIIKNVPCREAIFFEEVDDISQIGVYITATGRKNENKLFDSTNKIEYSIRGYALLVDSNNTILNDELIRKMEQNNIRLILKSEIISIVN